MEGEKRKAQTRAGAGMTEREVSSGWDGVRTGAAVVYCAALIGFSALAAQRGNAEFLFYGGVMIVLAGAVLALDRKVRLSHLALVGLVMWALLHLAGGTVRVGDGVLYSWRPVAELPKYDQVVHFFGFAVATLVAWECLAHAIAARTGERPRATTGLVTGAALIGMGLGGMNEVVEFVATLTLAETNVGGYGNTGWDLVSNLAGCVAMGVWIRAAR
jgi:uncharacterized membrane protein YjdF